jgi:hypothetical protein
MTIAWQYSAADHRRQHQGAIYPLFVTPRLQYLRAAGSLAGAVAAAGLTIGMGYGRDYQCIQEKNGCEQSE